MRQTNSKIVSTATESFNDQITNGKLMELNLPSFSIELLFIVTENSQSLSCKDVITSLHDRLHKELLSWLFKDSVFLESITVNSQQSTVKQMFPDLERHSNKSLSFATKGRLPSSSYVVSTRPFVLNMYSPFLRGNRNEFSIRIPRVVTAYQTHTEQKKPVPLDVVEKVCSLLILSQPLCFGFNKDLVLTLALYLL